MEYILHIPQCVARFPFIPRGRRLHIGSIRARAGCPCLAPAIDGSWRSLGTVRTLCRQWVLDTRLAYGLPLCPGSDGRPRCFSAVLSADRSRLASSSTICAAPARNGLIAPALPGAFLYSITSSARIRIDGGTVRPSALAVLVVTQLSAASTHEPSRGGA